MREATFASEKQKKAGIRRNDNDSSLTHSIKGSNARRLNSNQTKYPRRKKRSVEENSIDEMVVVQYSIGSPNLPKRIRLAVDLNSDYTLINCVSDVSRRVPSFCIALTNTKQKAHKLYIHFQLILHQQFHYLLSRIHLIR